MPVGPIISGARLLIISGARVLRVKYLDDWGYLQVARPTQDEVEALEWQQHIEYCLGYPCWVARETLRDG